MTKNVVFDSYAILALFRKERGHEEVAQLLTDISMGGKQGEKRAQLALDSLKQFPLEVENADYELTLAAAKLKAKHKLSYADAFAAALTIKKKGTLITGDKEFKSLDRET
ncbi:MAG: PIN domain-containing protein, partial [Nanoarchaeota archaeon]